MFCDSRPERGRFCSAGRGRVGAACVACAGASGGGDRALAPSSSSWSMRLKGSEGGVGGGGGGGGPPPVFRDGTGGPGRDGGGGVGAEGVPPSGASRRSGSSPSNTILFLTACRGTRAVNITLNLVRSGVAAPTPPSGGAAGAAGWGGAGGAAGTALDVLRFACCSLSIDAHSRQSSSSSLASPCVLPSTYRV